MYSRSEFGRGATFKDTADTAARRQPCHPAKMTRKILGWSWDNRRRRADVREDRPVFDDPADLVRSGRVRACAERLIR